jgi:hypothetical protein
MKASKSMKYLVLVLTFIFFSLEQCDRDINVDIVSFMTGLLLGADPQVRSWISFYIRNGQKKHNESLAAFRTKLLDQLKNLIMEAKEYQQRDGAISQVFFSIFINIWYF